MDLKSFTLMAGTFFCPFGYDAAVAFLMQVTGSYWSAIRVFYFISGAFFGWHIYLVWRSKKKLTSKQ